jgi:hypothetical protein
MNCHPLLFYNTTTKEGNDTLPSSSFSQTQRKRQWQQLPSLSFFLQHYHRRKQRHVVIIFFFFIATKPKKKTMAQCYHLPLLYNTTT